MTGEQPDKNVQPAEATACLVAEVIGNSSDDFSGAVHDGIARLRKMGVKVRGVDILSHKISLDETGRMTNYRVVLKVAYDGTL